MEIGTTRSAITISVSKRTPKIGLERSYLHNELSSLSAGWGGRVLSQPTLHRKPLKDQTNSGDIELCVASTCDIIKSAK